ncbi:hypothetical protein [Xenorhabdus griffiniae]|uniref:Uncharacterized protein n=1 Tax=Xenorhabdus griffiniae TaxID=351672 RepID=A0ABY9XDA0_9GAMM|nr:hypothetical protein [Xenorhabdus griffiniae]WMV70891.1 hypothetical protein QL128_11750 [Xenorhabdus griffiniae]WNH00567.1 hypothetical protein QL112_011755 [Xenorhabdus griffiniae]
MDRSERSSWAWTTLFVTSTMITTFSGEIFSSQLTNRLPWIELCLSARQIPFDYPKALLLSLLLC